MKKIHDYKHQLDDATEIAAVVRRCIILEKQSKWRELSILTNDLIEQFPNNLTIAELYVSAEINMRNWQKLSDYYDMHPKVCRVSIKLALLRFDFLALNGRYDDLIIHVWDCVKSGASKDLLEYFESSCISISSTDPAFSYALSNLTADPKLSPLSRIIASFSDLLWSPSQIEEECDYYDTSPLLDEKFDLEVNSILATNDLNEIELDPQRLVDYVLAKRGNSNFESSGTKIDVLIPVFSGFKQTMRCLASVILSEQKNKFSIIVIDDCTPDPKISSALDILSRAGLINLLRNRSNQGFVRSCNNGASINPDRDIILLNADTVVFGDWIDRISAHAENYPDAGTITPLSNNATICSYPFFCKDNPIPMDIDANTLDKIAASVNSCAPLLEIPTGVGFCMYVRRACIDIFGLFNYEKFGKGYGEENDFCQRIAAEGFKNFLAPNLFVYHEGETSFGDSAPQRKHAALSKLRTMYPLYEQKVAEYVEQDPGRIFRERIDVLRLKIMISKTRGAMLHVTHSLGGGTERHVQDLCSLLTSEQQIVLIARPLNEGSERFSIALHNDETLPNLPTFSCFDSSDNLVAFLSYIGVDHIHIHHLLGFGQLAPQYFRNIADKIRTDFTVHDYYSICPRINLIDASGEYCGGPAIGKCQSCITESKSYIPPYLSAQSWQESNVGMLSSMNKVFAPSWDCANRIARFSDRKDVIVRPHPIDANKIYNDCSTKCTAKLITSTGSDRKILIIGALNENKGSKLIESVALAARNFELPLSFHILGYSDNAKELSSIGNVFMHGPYTSVELPFLISAVNADFLWNTSIWPETFCYTFLEGILEGLFPVCFEIGAQAERVRSLGCGVTLPLSLQHKPRELALRLNSLNVDCSGTSMLDAFVFNGFEQYYNGNVDVT